VSVNLHILYTDDIRSEQH